MHIASHKAVIECNNKISARLVLHVLRKIIVKHTDIAFDHLAVGFYIYELNLACTPKQRAIILKHQICGMVDI